MRISVRSADDQVELQKRIDRERDAEQRDRYRVALLASGGLQTRAIMDQLDRSRGFVQRWAYAYRDGGVNAIASRPRGGSRPRLAPPQQEQFIARFTAGPTGADGPLVTLRGKDAVRILREEFGTPYSLNGVYRLFHRHNLAVLRPRPRHRKSDPEAQRRWRQSAPFLSSRSAVSIPTSR